MIQITDQMVIEEAVRLDKKFYDLPEEIQNRRYMEAEASLLEQYAKGRRLKMARDDWMAARRKLCALLRDQSQWPKRFVWDFRAPDNCAMGFARKAGFFEILSDANLQKTFGLTARDVTAVFAYPCGNVNDLGPWIGDATPEDVALALERVG